jgi:serine/threonine protein kinase
MYAIKQFPRGQNGYNSGLSEAVVNEQLSSEDCKSICHFYGAIETRQDLWLVFEAVDGCPIFTALNEIKGSFHGGARLYDVI